MWIFIESAEIVAIPENQITKIETDNATINIYFSRNNEAEQAQIIFPSKEKAVSQILAFFRALNRKDEAFFFSNPEAITLTSF